MHLLGWLRVAGRGPQLGLAGLGSSSSPARHKLSECNAGILSNNMTCCSLASLYLCEVQAGTQIGGRQLGTCGPSSCPGNPAGSECLPPPCLPTLKSHLNHLEPWLGFLLRTGLREVSRLAPSLGLAGVRSHQLHCSPAVDTLAEMAMRGFLPHSSRVHVHHILIQIELFRQDSCG